MNNPTMNIKILKNSITLIQDNTSKNNQSMEIQINTQYSKRLQPEKKSINKKIFQLNKKNYISPYSKKKILNSLKI